MNLPEKILKNLVEGRFLKVTFTSLRQFLTKLRSCTDWVLCVPFRYLLSKIHRVQSNKILFMTYNNDYMCNPKYICEELRRQELPVELVWATTTKKLRSGQFPDGVRPVVRGTYAFFKEAVTAKIWVDNAVCFPWNPVPKKKEQFYLQTWHGSLGLKRIGKTDVKQRRWVMAARLAGRWTDVCISNSRFETDVFRQTHWANTEILELGHARNDILFADERTQAEITARIRDFFHIPEGKHIALYAPTFRNDPASDAYCLDHSRLLDNLENRFGGNWVLLNRYHFKTKGVRNGFHADERIYAATTYPDMQELLVAADVGITDYSSWICDFVLTGKPGFLFTPDLVDYDQERGFYYPLAETPFPIAQTNDELECSIRDFDPAIYEQKRQEFLAARGCIEDGHAAKRIVEIIKRQCNL